MFMFCVRVCGVNMQMHQKPIACNHLSNVKIFFFGSELQEGEVKKRCKMYSILIRSENMFLLSIAANSACLHRFQIQFSIFYEIFFASFMFLVSFEELNAENGNGNSFEYR